MAYMEENFVGVGHRRKHAALSALFQRLHTDIYGNRDFLHVLRRNFCCSGRGEWHLATSLLGRSENSFDGLGKILIRT